jgi:hypothetical protein
VADGDAVHLDCHLGLLDASAAVARLLRERPGHALCTNCIAVALVITPLEAQTGTRRLRALRGFEMRFGTCLGCGGRRQVLRVSRNASGERPSAGAAAQ